jgi:hypothetical protein
LQGEIETLKEQLAASEARIEKQATESAEQLAEERTRADKAIAAFGSLADKLDALAPHGRGRHRVRQSLRTGPRGDCVKADRQLLPERP